MDTILRHEPLTGLDRARGGGLVVGVDDAHWNAPISDMEPAGACYFLHPEVIAPLLLLPLRSQRSGERERSADPQFVGALCPNDRGRH
jgi:hypothetical protein